MRMFRRDNVRQGSWVHVIPTRAVLSDAVDVVGIVGLQHLRYPTLRGEDAVWWLGMNDSEFEELI